MQGVSKPNGGRRFTAGALVSVAGCLIVVGSARAQDVASARAYSWTPRVAVQETFTDNVGLTDANRESDFVTQVTVGFDATLNGPRTQGTLTADANYNLYANTSNLNGWSFNGYGVGSFSVVKDVLALESEGQVQTGSISSFGEPALERTTPKDRVQIGIFSVGPHLTTTVGSAADLDASVRVNQVSYRVADGSTALDVPQDSTYLNANASLDTKERYNRYQLAVVGQYAADDNDFELYNAIGSAYLSVNPSVRVFGRAGYEIISQPGVVDLDSPVWSAGVELTLNERSKITLEGGERYDRPSYNLDAFVQLSDNFLLTARYFEQIQPAQLSLGGGFVGFVDQAARLPAGLAPGTFDIQGNLYNETSLQKTAEVHLVYRWPTQMIDFSTSWSDQFFLDTDAHDRSVTGELRYQRQLRPDLTLEARGRYDRTYASPTFGETRSYNGAFSLLYALRETTNISVGYAYEDNKQLATAGQHIYENAVFIALLKRF